MISLKKHFAWIIPIISFVFIVKILSIYSGQIIGSIQQVNWFFVLLSAIFFLAYFYLRAFAWSLILMSPNLKIKRKDIILDWFLSEAARFMPGNIWSVASRIIRAENMGFSKKQVVSSFTIEIIFVLIVTTLFSLPTIIRDHVFPIIVLFGLFLLIIGLFYLTKSPKYKKNLSVIFKLDLFGKNKIFGFLILILAWFCFGTANLTLVINFATPDDFFHFLSISITAWLFGYLSFITPMGLGIRDGIFILLLSQDLNFGQATMVAVLSRVVLIFVEGFNLVVVLLLREKGSLLLIFKNIKNHIPRYILSSLILLYALVLSWLVILRHDAFASSFDLANMDQTIWNTLHGNFFSLSTENGLISRFSIHADLMLVLLSPLYLIWDNVKVLIVFAAFALAMGAIPVYLLAKKIINNTWISFCIVIAYLLNPGMQWASIYDFHAVSLAIPLLLTTFYFAFMDFIKKKTREVQGWTRENSFFVLFAILALLTKEEISLFLLTLGLIIWIVFKNKSIGIVTSIVSLTYFVLMVFVVIPFFSTDGFWALKMYQFSNSSAPSNYGALSTVFNTFFSNSTFEYANTLLKPYGYLPLLGLPWLILSLPEFVINVLSDNPYMRMNIFHYDAGVIPGLVISLIFGFHFINIFLQKLKLTKFVSYSIIFILAAWLIFASLRTNYHYSPLPTTPSCWCLLYVPKKEDLDFEAVLQSLPKDASITASSEIRPHLTHRKRVFNLPEGTQSAQFIAIIDQERVPWSFRTKDYESQLIQQLLTESRYQKYYQSEHFYIFKKR